MRQRPPPRGQHRARFGNYEAGRRGADRADLADPYRLAMALTWPRFVLALLGAELALNLVFALLYLARPGAIANAHPGSIPDAFFFSIETLATVGYGEMYPADLYGHVVSAIEILAGVGFMAVLTGLVFVRVSRPRPCFRYPELLVVGSRGGRPALMVRVAGGRLGLLYDAEARLSVLLPDPADAARAGRRIAELKLVQHTIPVFALSWLLVHVIDDDSPLAGLDGPGMAAAGLRLFVMLRAEDATLGTTIRDLRAYIPTQIQFGMRYATAITSDEDGHPVLDLDRLGTIEPDGAEPDDAAPDNAAPDNAALG